MPENHLTTGDLDKLFNYQPKKILLKNPIALDPDKEFLPDKLLFREKQLVEIVEHLTAIINGVNPGNAILRGRTGTGKTITIRYALTPFRRYIKDNNLKIGIAYASGHAVGSGKYTPSPQKYIGELMKSLGYKISMPKRGGIGWVGLLELLRDYIEKKRYQHVIFVCDDIHRIEDLSFLMYFARPQQVWGLDIDVTAFLITADAKTLEKIPKEAKYSFSKVNIYFPHYNAHELYGILKQRLEYALTDPSIISEGALRLIAAKIAQRGGDARYALRVLKIVVTAYIFDTLRERDNITEKDIDDALAQVDYEDITKVVDNLPLHAKLLLVSILLKGGVVDIRDLYNSYVTISQSIGITPVSLRWVRENLTYLEKESLVVYDVKSGGRGHGKISRVYIPPEIVSKRALIESLKKEEIFKDLINWERFEEKILRTTEIF